MKAGWEQKLTSIWYGEVVPAWWLKCLSPVYRLAFSIDRWRQSRRRCDDLSAACIIVVGNITAGGSGKTPLVIRLCRLFRQAGFNPGVISRGYGRKTRELRLVSPASSASDVGDEPLLISKRAGVPVIVAADRCEAARTLRKQGVDVIVSDDGLQHHRLPRKIEICVIDGSRRLGNGRLIPAGPLREPEGRLNTVDDVVVNGELSWYRGAKPAQPMKLVAGMLRSLSDDLAWRLSQFKGCKVNAVAAIGNPDRFFLLLEQSGISVIEHRFPDHHVFSESDFSGMNPDFPILMTEKDAVKCTGLGLENAWYLCVDAALPSEWERDITGRVARLLNAEGPPR